MPMKTPTTTAAAAAKEVEPEKAPFFMRPFPTEEKGRIFLSLKVFPDKRVGPHRARWEHRLMAEEEKG